MERHQRRSGRLLARLHFSLDARRAAGAAEPVSAHRCLVRCQPALVGKPCRFNKGLAGATDAAIAAARTTAMNPDVLTAFALAIIGDVGASLFTGASPDPGAHARAERVQAAMSALRAAAPGSGAYLNECDYFPGELATGLLGFKLPAPRRYQEALRPRRPLHCSSWRRQRRLER